MSKSKQQEAYRKFVLVPAPPAAAAASQQHQQLLDEEKNKAARHAEEIKSLRHYNPTLESLATLREQFEAVFSRADLVDADKLALIHNIQKRFDALKPNLMGSIAPQLAPAPEVPALAVAQAPPPAAPVPAGAPPPPAAVQPPAAAAAAAVAATPSKKTEQMEQQQQQQKEPVALKGLPQKYDMKIDRFERHILKRHPDRIAENVETGELLIDGKPVPNSNYADLMRELFISNKIHNLTGMESVITTLRDLISSSSHSIDKLISNSKIINQIAPDTQQQEAEPSASVTASSTHSTAFHPYSRPLKHNVKYQDAHDNPLPDPSSLTTTPTLPLPPGQVPKTLRLYD